MWSEFPSRGKAIAEQILVSEERNKSKRAGLWESQSVIQVGRLTIWVRLFEIEKIITEFTRSISSTRMRKPVFIYDDVKVSKDKHISRSADWETSSMLDEIESKAVHKDQEVIDRWKRSKTWSEVKPVK